MRSFAEPLRYIVQDYYRIMEIAITIDLSQPITQNLLSTLIDPLKNLVPQSCGFTLDEKMTFREYFADFLFERSQGNNSITPEFPLGAYRQLAANYPYPETFPEYTASDDDNLRIPLFAVYEFCLKHEKTTPQILDLPLKKMGDFLLPLCQAFDDTNSPGMYLESLIDMLSFESEPFWEVIDNFNLEFPSFSTESEEADVLISFLEGYEAVAATLSDIYNTEDETVQESIKDNLAPEDRRLIVQIGFLELLKTYAETDEGRQVPLNKIADSWNTYMADWRAKYPRIDEEGWYICPYNHTEITFTPRTVTDIEMVFDYCTAFDDLMGDLPTFSATCYEFYRAEEFHALIKEICQIYRSKDQIVEESHEAAA